MVDSVKDSIIKNIKNVNNQINYFRNVDINVSQDEINDLLRDVYDLLDDVSLYFEKHK